MSLAVLTEIDPDIDAYIEQQMAAMREHYERPYAVMCDICDAECYAPEASLRRLGWELGKGYAFCPAH